MFVFQIPVPTPTLYPVSQEMAPIMVDANDFGMWEHVPWGIQIWNRLPDGSPTIIQVAIILAIIFVFVRVMIYLINQIMEDADQ